MAAISGFAQKQMINYSLGLGAPTAVGTCGVGLSLAAPTSVSGTEVASASGVTRKTAIFSTCVLNQSFATLATAITFSPLSAAMSISGIHIWDTIGVAADAGNMMWYGLLTAPKTVASGDSLVIASGALTVSLV